ncbi:unnamed protein product [Caenorhabditis bovis]|uniref:C-CAP/cofactor C-like domain-containing protein n=1 Tax=Caenorhabditis bovis TaxID=2654633 RepID=A0A8S1ERK2_9PELO|nr:unnamed protein product [Caenorhabditis bovis]
MDVSLQETNEKLIEAKREKLLAKLTAQHKDLKKNEAGKVVKDENNEIEELMDEIRKELYNKNVDSTKVDRLQKYLTFSIGNHRTKAIQNLLEEVRKFKLSQKPPAKFSGFSFSKSKSTTPAAPVEYSKPQEKPIENPIFSAENIVENLKYKNEVIHGKNLEDLSLRNIENCNLEFDFVPSVVHIRNIKNSSLKFTKCDRSILLHDCENVHLHVAAQQIRCHTSKNLHLHVATRGAVILEESTGIVMHPFRMKHKDGSEIVEEDNGEWKTPRDFDWLAQTQSPNWRLASEDENTWETLSF